MPTALAMVAPQWGSSSSGLWLVLVAWLQLIPPFTRGDGEGTTPFIRDIFVGRCWDYQAHINSEAFVDGRKNCTQLWEVFQSAFVYREACHTYIEQYDIFTEMAYHPLPRDKLLFWSGVYPFVKQYTNSGERLIGIGDTLAGYILDGLNWCSQQHTPGMNFDMCPLWGSCIHTAQMSFWKAVSVKFSQSARGTVHILFNGSRDKPPFDSESVFAGYELPNFHVEHVSHVKVTLLQSLGDRDPNTCSHSSLIELKYVIEGRGITYQCVENPPDVLYLLCSSQPEAAECQTISGGATYIACGTGFSTTIHMAPLLITAIVALIL